MKTIRTILESLRINRLLSVLASAACLVWLTASAEAQYAGLYSGTYWGDDVGTWDVWVDTRGKLTGYADDSFGQGYEVRGSVSSSGQMRMLVGQYSDGVFEGRINTNGVASGTWINSHGGGRGTFEGTRVAGPEPALTVQQSDHIPIEPGATRDFGRVPLKKKATVTFIASSEGTADLIIRSVSVTGTNAADFKLTGSLSAPIKPGKDKNFKIQFAPTTAGVKSAQLRITSNDPDESVYLINLTGTAG